MTLDDRQCEAAKGVASLSVVQESGAHLSVTPVMAPSSWPIDKFDSDSQPSIPRILAFSRDSLFPPEWEEDLLEVVLAAEDLRSQVAGPFPTPLIVALIGETLVAGASCTLFGLSLTGIATMLPALPAGAVALGFSGLVLVNARLIIRWGNRAWLRSVVRWSGS